MFKTKFENHAGNHLDQIVPVYVIIYHYQSGRISSVILAESVAASKKAEATLRHEHLAVLPIAKSQMSDYVIIENLIINHNHMKKTDVAKKKKKFVN